MTEIMLMMSVMDLLSVSCYEGLSRASSLKAMPAHLVEGEGLEYKCAGTPDLMAALG